MLTQVYNFKNVKKPYRFQATKHIKSLNNFKLFYKDDNLDKEELQYILRCCGLPTNNHFLAEFRKSTWIVRTSRSTWKFAPFTEWMKPEGLERIYANYYKRVN